MRYRSWLTAGVLAAAGLLTRPAGAAEPNRNDLTTRLDDGTGKTESEALVDWPEPDRSPPPKMLSRLSVGMLAGFGSPLGYGAIEAEWVPWYLGGLNPALHA